MNLKRNSYSGAGAALCALFFIATVFSGVYAAFGSRNGKPASVSRTSGVSSPLKSAKSSSSAKPSASKTSQLRAVWIATTQNINFPSKTGLSADQQKKEIDSICDNVKSAGLNAVFVQVRANSDALYKSQIYPWSQALTGTQGKDPGYDPLACFVAAAHKRGLKIEAWVNPYRVQGKADLAGLAASNPARQHADWTFKSEDGGLFLNPGLPQVQDLIEKGIMEIVKNYDVDGVVFDDYFYPDKKIDDSAAFKQYGKGAAIEDWRRDNVTALVKTIHDQVKKLKKSVVFGISPFAVWANKSSNASGSDTQAGYQSYYDQFADTRLWVQKGYVDFICPQIYWKIGFSQADYTKVLDWWANTVKGTSVSFYIANGVYRIASDSWSADEIINQLKAAAKYDNYGGSAFYGYAQIAANTGGVKDAIQSYYGSSA